MILIALSMSVAFLLILAGVIDFRSRLIPNWISLSIVLLYFAFLAAQHLFVFPVEPLQVVSSLAVGVVVGILFTTLFVFKKLGGGDVKLITAMSFWAGLKGITAFLLMMALFGGLVALVYLIVARMRKTKKNKPISGSGNNTSGNMDIPYGIAISLSGLLCIKSLLTLLMA